jgi:hypothetical protein
MMQSCSWLLRLRRPVFLWWLAALLTQLAVDWLFGHRALPLPARILFGFLPAVMWIFVAVAFVRVFVKLDELQQRIHLQAVSVAFVPTTILMLVFSGLERAGIYRASWSDVVDPFVILLLLAHIFFAWRYR